MDIRTMSAISRSVLLLLLAQTAAKAKANHSKEVREALKLNRSNSMNNTRTISAISRTVLMLLLAQIATNAKANHSKEVREACFSTQHE